MQRKSRPVVSIPKKQHVASSMSKQTQLIVHSVASIEKEIGKKIETRKKKHGRDNDKSTKRPLYTKGDSETETNDSVDATGTLATLRFDEPKLKRPKPPCTQDMKSGNLEKHTNGMIRNTAIIANKTARIVFVRETFP